MSDVSSCLESQGFIWFPFPIPCLESPWYNLTGWLGIKHQLTYSRLVFLPKWIVLLGNKHAHACMYVHTYILHACMHTRVHAYMCTHTLAHTSHTHARTHPHTHAQTHYTHLFLLVQHTIIYTFNASSQSLVSCLAGEAAPGHQQRKAPVGNHAGLSALPHRQDGEGPRTLRQPPGLSPLRLRHVLQPLSARRRRGARLCHKVCDGIVVRLIMWMCAGSMWLSLAGWC